MQGKQWKTALHQLRLALYMLGSFDEQRAKQSTTANAAEENVGHMPPPVSEFYAEVVAKLLSHAAREVFALRGTLWRAPNPAADAAVHVCMPGAIGYI